MGYSLKRYSVTGLRFRPENPLVILDYFPSYVQKVGTPFISELPVEILPINSPYVPLALVRRLSHSRAISSNVSAKGNPQIATGRGAF